MPKDKPQIVDTILNEFVYTALYRADYQSKRELPPKYSKIILDEQAARNFADKSTRDEKEIVLALLGYEFYYVVHRSGKPFNQIKDFLPLMGSKSVVSKIAAEEGFYVISDREIVSILGLMSGTTHNPFFYLDTELIRQGYNIRKWKKKYANAKELSHRDADESAKMVCKNIYGAMMLSQTCKLSLGLSPAGLSILLYFYAFGILEATPEKLKEILVGRFSPTEITYAIKELVLGHFISKLLGKYSITGSGVKKVNTAFHDIIHATSF